MGYSRQQFSLTNTLRCRPRNNWLSGAPWEFSALNRCRPNLDAAIRDRRPRAILALGDTALRELTGEAGEARGVSHLGGYVLPLGRFEEFKKVTDAAPIPVIPTWHPAFIRRGKASLQGVFARNLQRAVSVAAGKDREWEWDLEEAQRNGRIRYSLHPSLDDAERFALRVATNRGLTVSYDIETFESASLDEDARDGFTDTRIRLIQFSVGSGEGIAFPWEGRYREIAAAILHSDNVKCGHNLWLFDNKVLEACGQREGLDLRPRGPIHDTLAMFHHWQPDLPAHLQFAAQFVQFPFPWKHLAATDLEFYGCVDVDATLRLYTFLRAALEKDGLWDSPYDASGDCVGGYVGQVAQVRPILAAMERRGLPVDDAERLKLDGEFDAAQRELMEVLDGRFPNEARSIHPKDGYKKTPKDTLGMVRRDFPVAVVNDASNEPEMSTVSRWCRTEPFSPNSSHQLIRYMKAKGHKVPKSREQDAEGNDKDTTAKKELVRLAHRSGDDFYLRVIEYRELSKMRGTYIEGFKPHSDGRVHTTFTFDTGIGQLSCCASWTPVMTEFGSTPISEVEVGTRVWTHERRWRKVIATWVYDPQPMYDVYLSNGLVLTCLTDHKLLVFRQAWFRDAQLDRNSRRWARVSDLCWAQSVTLPAADGSGLITIKKIIPVGCFPVHDITVEEDESYASCGVFSHNSRNPNIQNFPKHGRLARATRRMIAAPEGHLLVEWDYKSCHVLTLGFLAEDENYIRFAPASTMHSIVTGHY